MYFNMKKSYQIRQWDSFELINKIKNNSIDLVITSPPYNIGKVYEKKNQLEKYLEPYKQFAKTLFQKISPTWSVCRQVGNYIEKGEVYPLDIYFYNIFKDAGFKLRNRIIRHFEHGLHAQSRFSGRYETILRFTKDDKYIFNLDAVRVPSKYPGKLHYKWPKKWLPSWNPLWKNPSDFWKTIEEDRNKLIWDIPNVKSNHPEKTKHPCQFPVELVQRCILALTKEGDTVLDPFLWVGSSIIWAILQNRIWLWFEYDKDFVTISKERIQQLEKGELKIRKLGTPIYQPTGKEKASQNPFKK